MDNQKKLNIDVTAIGELLFDVYPEYKKLGGAPFNFLYHVWKLTGSGNFISRVGSDEYGDQIIDKLEKQKFDTRFIQRDNEHQTGIVNVELDDDKVPSFDIIENRAYDFIEVNDKLIEVVESSSLFYFGSLVQRNETSRNTIQKLADKSVKGFCDLNIRQNFYTKDTIDKSLEKSTAVKLNSDELKLVNELILKEKYDLRKTAKKVLSEYKLELLCITVGSDGAYLFNKESESHYKAEIQNIVDTVGAGDAYAAMMSIGYLRNWEIEKINKLASEFAADICKVNGAIPEDGEIYNKYMERIKDE